VQLEREKKRTGSLFEELRMVKEQSLVVVSGGHSRCRESREGGVVTGILLCRRQ
jgi:hypothetical protein